MISSIVKFNFIQNVTVQLRHLNANTASVAKIHRKIYAKMYPCMLVLSDGATVNFRYHEPRKIITLPLDVSTLSESDRLARIERRKPKIKVKIEEEIQDTYNAKKYLNYGKAEPKRK